MNCSQIKYCPDCSSDTTIHSNNSHELVCEQCGLVLATEKIDHGPEWRAYSRQEHDAKSRVGAPTTRRLHDKGLTTQIDWRNKDGYGHSISETQRIRMNRLRKWQERIRTRDSKERNLQHACSEIERMSSALGLPDLPRESACILYRRACAKDLIRGRSIEAVSTSCLYAACRQEGLPRSLNEMAQVAQVQYKSIAQTYRELSKNLNLWVPLTNAKQYIPRFASELNLSQEVQNQASDIINATRKDGLHSGKSPTGIAAGALYLSSIVCNEKKNQSEIARVAQVTKGTIRERYREQLEAMKSQSMHPIRKSRLLSQAESK